MERKGSASGPSTPQLQPGSSTSQLEINPSTPEQYQPVKSPRSTPQLPLDPSTPQHQVQQLQSLESPRSTSHLQLNPSTLQSLESPRLNTKSRFLEALGAEEIKPNVYGLTKPYFQTLQSLEVNNPGLWGDIESEKFR